MDIKIGNTPLVKIHYKYNGESSYIYTKLEYYNLTGSIKDRIAYYIITKAKERGELKDGMPIIEATSGNTGISLSALGAYFHHPVYIFMPDWVSSERLNLMKMYGATVKLFSKKDGGFTRCIQEATKLSKEINGFLSSQFSNADNVLAHYETTGNEISEALPEEVGGFVSGVGTGGTLMGIGRRLRKDNENLVVAALEPAKMPMLSKGIILGPHKIEGIGDEFIPKIVDKNLIDTVLLINDEDAINMSRLLAKNLGLGVGISSGANMIGAVCLQSKLKKPIVTVFADDNKKYITTDLSKDIDLNRKFTSNAIELIDYEVI